MKKLILALTLVACSVKAYDSTELTKQIEECAKVDKITSVEQFKEITSTFDVGLVDLTKAWAYGEAIKNAPKAEDMKACNEKLMDYVKVLKNGN